MKTLLRNLGFRDALNLSNKMNKQFISTAILVLLIIVYLIVTIIYFNTFRKNKLFSRNIKVFHLVMIWLVPFVWILILKNLTAPTPGSFEIKNKRTPAPFSDNNDDASRASNMGF